jgi:hypothetical protein
MSLRASAYVWAGRWVAACPRPDCFNAEHFDGRPGDGRYCQVGHVGGLTGATFHCRRCGLKCQADWPPNVDEIDYLLSLRPVPETRNWNLGEDLHDLLAENLTHGITPELPPSGEGGLVLSIVGDHIEAGRELVAAHHRAIARN